jgi:hypothetical protein
VGCAPLGALVVSMGGGRVVCLKTILHEIWINIFKPFCLVEVVQLLYSTIEIKLTEHQRFQEVTAI